MIGAGTAGFGFIGAAYLGVVLVAWLQERVPEQLRGRIMSLVVLAVVALDPLSYALAGVLLPAGTTIMSSVCGAVETSAVVGVLEVEPASGVPFRALVTVCRAATGVGEHSSQVHQVPGHEGGVAVGEVVLGLLGAGERFRVQLMNNASRSS